MTSPCPTCGKPLGKGRGRAIMYPENFEGLWAIYPRKTGKGAAHEAFRKALVIGATLEEITDGVKRHLAFFRSKGVEFVPHLATWLNQNRWQDEVPVDRRHDETYGDGEQNL